MVRYSYLEERSWTVARSHCQAMNADLAILDTPYKIEQAENFRLVSQLKNWLMLT